MKLATLILVGCVNLSSVLAQFRFGPRTFDLDTSMVGPRIINGVDVKPGEIPYQVSLQTKSNNFHFCGGSVLNRNYVITAAHCVQNNPASTIQVIVGTTDLRNPQSVHEVDRAIVHENYNQDDSWRNDIALLLLSTPIGENEQVSAVALPQQNADLPPNSPVVVSGWGRTSENGETTPLLKRATIYITEQEYCRGRYQTINYAVYDTHVCASDPDVERGSCQGDSGGPLTLDGTLVGLVSWAAGCAQPDYPAVYTRVPSYVDWIEANMN